MEKVFDDWNKQKKEIDKNNDLLNKFPKEGDVWIAILGKNIGFEQNGSGTDFLRPVLVVKKFNNHMFWAIPLSTKQKDFDFYFNFTDPHNHSVSLILAQLRLVSIKRFQRKMYEMPQETFTHIKRTLQKFF